MMNSSHTRRSLFLTLTAALVSASVATSSGGSMPEIPYDGKNVHLQAQYLRHREQFHNSDGDRNRHLVGRDESSAAAGNHPNNFHLDPRDRRRHFDFYNRRHALNKLPHHDEIKLDSPAEEWHLHYDVKVADQREDQPRTQLDSSAEEWHLHYDVKVAGQREEQPKMFEDATNIVTATTLLEEQKLPDKLVFSTTDQEQSHQQRHTPQHSSNIKNSYKKDWKDAYIMFGVWSLDNLFWLTPFVAHSPFHAVTFVVTYQVLVLASCTLAPAAHGMSFADAHSHNILWGAAAAIVCWILALVFWIRLQQKQSLALLMSSNHSGKSMQQQQQESLGGSDLETPLLEKPSAATNNHVSSSLSRYFTLTPICTILLTVGMTLLAATDDFFFVPVLVEKHTLSVLDVQMGAMFACVVCSGVALLVAFCCEDKLSRIPLYMVFYVYAGVLTGRSAFDLATSPEAQHTLVEFFSLFHGNK